VAACAMLLPGVSGSFMLLMLGQYEFMLSALSGLEIVIILFFVVGFGCGAFFMSKVISHFIKKHESKTIAFLVGLMFGALRLPLEKILSNGGEFWTATTISITILSGIIGLGLIFLIEKMK